jgi:SAM-dependent methyltransferase
VPPIARSAQRARAVVRDLRCPNVVARGRRSFRSRAGFHDRTARRAARRRRGIAALAAGLCLAAGLVRAQDEVPFITTPDQVTLAMLELARVGPTDHVIDLGSGDGRIVITAAKRFGASGLGVEIVPELVRKSRELARAAGVQERARFREQDLFATDLGRASVVTMYLLPTVNLQLRPRLLALAPGTRIVSHDWDLGDWLPERTLTVDVPDKAVGREKVSRIHLWTVPAQVGGTWCAPGHRLEIVQRFQTFSATLAAQGSPVPLVFDGRIEGTTLRALGTPPIEIVLDSAALRSRRSDGALSAGWPADASFRRASGTIC